MSVGVYHPGQSPLHRLGPGTKLLMLAAFAVAVSLTDNIALLLAIGVSVLVAWNIAGLTWPQLRQNVQPLTWMLLALFGFQFVVAGFFSALDTLLSLATLVIAAALISHTTRTDDMLEALTIGLCPFTRFGLKAEDAAFALVFAVRLVPFVSAVGREAIEARLARGAGRNPLPALVPMVIRLMRETDTLSEALVARGFGRS